VNVISGAGIAVKNGAVAGFQMQVTGSFDLLGLHIDLGSPTKLTVDYVVGTNTTTNPTEFAMSGDVKVSTAQQPVSSISNQVFDTVTASFVKDQYGTPGLEIINGAVSNLNVTVNGSFDLFGLTISPENLNIKYSGQTGIMQLTGGLSVQELFKATATFGA